MAEDLLLREVLDALTENSASQRDLINSTTRAIAHSDRLEVLLIKITDRLVAHTNALERLIENDANARTLHRDGLEDMKKHTTTTAQNTDRRLHIAVYIVGGLIAAATVIGPYLAAIKAATPSP